MLAEIEFSSILSKSGILIHY